MGIGGTDSHMAKQMNLFGPNPSLEHWHALPAPSRAAAIDVYARAAARVLHHPKETSPDGNEQQDRSATSAANGRSVRASVVDAAGEGEHGKH